MVFRGEYRGWLRALGAAARRWQLIRRGIYDDLVRSRVERTGRPLRPPI